MRVNIKIPESRGHFIALLHIIFYVIKSRRMRCAGHVARVGKRRGVYRVFVVIPQRRRPLGRPRRRWGIILRWIFRK